MLENNIIITLSFSQNDRNDNKFRAFFNDITIVLQRHQNFIMSILKKIMIIAVLLVISFCLGMYVADTSDICEEDKRNLKEEIKECTTVKSTQNSNCYDSINRLESALRLSEANNNLLLESEHNKTWSNQHKLESIESKLEQCIQDKISLQTKSISEQQRYHTCEAEKVHLQTDADAERAKVSECEANQRRYKKDLDKCEETTTTLHETHYKEKEDWALKVANLTETLTSQKLLIVTLSSNYSACQIKEETCVRHLSTCETNLEDKIQQYSTCLSNGAKSEAEMKSLYNNCVMSLSKCELQGKYVTGDHTVCQRKLEQCNEDLQSYKTQRCFGIRL